jgi:hypothetical protein
MIQGRCLCGTVRYELDGPVTNLLHCHCSMCRKHHGTPFATWAAAPLAGFRFTAGDDAVERHASSAGFHRSFCRHCGSVVPEANATAGLAICPAGNLDGDLGIEPQLHMFVGSKAPWYRITDDLPQYDEYPPQFGMSATPRQRVETGGAGVAGSCLCGAVAYEIDGPPMRMYYCHCSRCRLGRSAAHASNVFFKAQGFRWTRGAELVREFALPGAQFFGTAFCSRCGSAMPRVSLERDIVNVPAGSLDTDPGIEPAAHIFVDSKAPWDRITDSIPQFAEMPPRR